MRDTVKAAAVAAGLTFIDSLETRLRTTGITSTLQGDANIGATSASSAALFPIGSTVKIGTGSAASRRIVTTVSGVGPYNIGFAEALTVGHSSGQPIAQVGPSLWTGTGRVGATTGIGNCDLWVSSDAVHPTQMGHDGIAAWAASEVYYQLST